MEAHQSKIYSLCYRMTGNAEDAADLTQEVFLSFHGVHFVLQGQRGVEVDKDIAGDAVPAATAGTTSSGASRTCGSPEWTCRKKCWPF